MKKLFLMGAVAVLVAACGGQKKEVALPQLLDEQAFATELDGKAINLYTLKNENGMAVQVTNYGARLVDIWVPDKDGNFKDVIMGFETGEAYVNATDINYGPVVGRYGNRIGKGQFTLDGKDYQLTINNGENHLHGGINGFSGKVWDAQMFKGADSLDVVQMTYFSADGEEGYPGNLTLTVTYTLTPKNELVINYKATTDAPTILNPTSHAYFNLHGTNDSLSLSHIMTIYADSYTPTDAGLIPTGEIAGVEGTPLDFRTPTAIGERIDQDFEALVFGGGYDHNWILNKPEDPKAVTLAAEVYEPSNGIVMKILTDQPGMQFYSGNFMKGNVVGKRGNVNTYRSGIALETQNFPDAINHENFPSPILRPEEVYTQTCIYAFEVRK